MTSKAFANATDANRQQGGSRNKIINGSMVHDQRNAGAAVTLGASGSFPVDRWKSHEDTDGSATAQQVSDAPAGFLTSIKVTVTSTDASLTGLQYFDIRQQIEGYNIADLSFGTAAAKAVTISFWVKSSVTGTYGGGISNGGFNRSYPFTYSISAADTWEYKTITISGDTSGTWTTTNGTGMYLFFNLGSGPDYAGTAGQWNAAGDLAATGTTNLIATNGATFYITGVQLEVGDTATPFEHRSYGEELALCYRYFQKFGATGASGNYAGFGSGICGSSTNTAIYMQTAPKRSSPTVTMGGNLRVLDGISPPLTVSGLSGDSYFDTNGNGYVNITYSGGTGGRPSLVTANNDTDAFIAFSSEL